MSDTLRPVTRRATRERHDPTGKAALFSGAADLPELDEVDADPDDASLFSDAWKPFTASVDCSACGRRSRVTLVDFALANLPVGLWFPLPGLRYNRRMTCPSCARWTWVRVRWLS
ncbi:MAG TPA: hypothetical protein VFZ83_08800 [Acidimicrobiia bacterium]|nr:hypothetical protein [Acidimicrobiia bacterium]